MFHWYSLAKNLIKFKIINTNPIEIETKEKPLNEIEPSIQETSQEEIKTNNNTRRIIYVDASFSNETKEAKISLYDQEINKLDTLRITKAKNSGDAEKYAILYACLYTKKKNISNRKVHILNDNDSVTKDEQILKICQYFQVTLSWIPREINAIADKGTKLEINIKEEESYLLELFYDIVLESNFYIKAQPEPAKETLESLLDELFLLRKDILYNALKSLTKTKEEQIGIGILSQHLKANYSNFNFNSPKKELEKYPETFTIVNQNHVKLSD